MIVKRKIKTFAASPLVPQQPFLNPTVNSTPAEQQTQQVTARDLQVENMKLQRQMMINSRMKAKIENDNRIAQAKTLAEMQKTEAKKDQAEKTAMTRMQKTQAEAQQSPAERNWASIRQKSKPTGAVPMKN